jgi:lipopolysaccharide export system protein LptC
MVQRFSFIMLVLIAMLSCWLLWHYVINLQWGTLANPNNPDAFAYNLQVNVMDDNGQPQYIFSSPYLVHYAVGDRVILQKPVMTMYNGAQPPWLLHADHGEAFNGNDMVKLWGNVNMSQAVGTANPSTLIKTTEITVYPKQRIATTKQYISAVQPNVQMNSVGMKLDLAQKTLDLLSQVQGVYEPTKS